MDISDNTILQVQFIDPAGNRRTATVLSDWLPVDDDELQARLQAISTFYQSLGCQVTNIAKLETMASDIRPRPRARMIAIK